MSELCKIVKKAALRWLHSIDLRPHSKTLGVCDREYWAWKTKDFPNGTMQSGLSGFLDAVFLLDLDATEIKRIVNAVLKGTKKIQRSDGSFEEAYPFESSYCVTGLVLFNLMYCIRKHKSHFDDYSYELVKNISIKSYNFLRNTSESHGIISNHIATSVIAMYLYEKYFDCSSGYVDSEMKSFLSLQNNDEGWFNEYNGADPGYQTLLNHYIHAGVIVEPALNSVLKEVWEKSVDFVSNFWFSDGSFGGEFGSRGTSILYPSGVFCESITEMLKWFFDKHIDYYGCVDPLVVDYGNFVPVFNSWALVLNRVKDYHLEEPSYNLISVRHFRSANLYVYTHEKTRLVLNTFNGTFRCVCNEGLTCSLATLRNYNFFSQIAQIKNLEVLDKKISFKYYGGKISQRMNSPVTAVVLRIIGSSIYYLPFLKIIFKTMLAKFVIQKPQMNNKELGGIIFHLDHSTVTYEVELASDSEVIEKGFYIHMASSNTYR